MAATWALAVWLGPVSGVAQEPHGPVAPAGVPPDDLFQTSSDCLACHNGLTTPAGEDVSIGVQWRASMMANSSRDPYWHAAVRCGARRSIIPSTRRPLRTSARFVTCRWRARGPARWGSRAGCSPTCRGAAVATRSRRNWRPTVSRARFATRSATSGWARRRVLAAASSWPRPRPTGRDPSPGPSRSTTATPR